VQNRLQPASAPATLYQDPTLRGPRQQSKINRHPHSAPALALFGHRKAPACARASAHQRRSSRLHTLSHRPDATLCPLYSARHLPRGTASPRFIVNRRRTLPKRVQGRFASEKHRRLRRSTPFASCRKLSCIADLERLQICKSRLNRGDSNHRCSRRLPLELSLGSGANALLPLQRGPEKTTFP
jgi:hypothetical protein